MKDFLLQYQQKLLVGNSDSSPALDSYYNHNGSTGNSSYSTSKDELLRAQPENNTNGNINPVNLATLLKDTTLGSYLTNSVRTVSNPLRNVVVKVVANYQKVDDLHQEKPPPTEAVNNRCKTILAFQQGSGTHLCFGMFVKEYIELAEIYVDSVDSRNGIVHGTHWSSNPGEIEFPRWMLREDDRRAEDAYNAVASTQVEPQHGAKDLVEVAHRLQDRFFVVNLHNPSARLKRVEDDGNLVTSDVMRDRRLLPPSSLELHRLHQSNKYDSLKKGEILQGASRSTAASKDKMKILPSKSRRPADNELGIGESSTSTMFPPSRMMSAEYGAYMAYQQQASLDGHAGFPRGMMYGSSNRMPEAEFSRGQMYGGMPPYHPDMYPGMMEELKGRPSMGIPPHVSMSHLHPDIRWMGEPTRGGLGWSHASPRDAIAQANGLGGFGVDGVEHGFRGNGHGFPYDVHYASPLANGHLSSSIQAVQAAQDLQMLQGQMPIGWRGGDVSASSKRIADGRRIPPGVAVPAARKLSNGIPNGSPSVTKAATGMEAMKGILAVKDEDPASLVQSSIMSVPPVANLDKRPRSSPAKSDIASPQSLTGLSMGLEASQNKNKRKRESSKAVKPMLIGQDFGEGKGDGKSDLDTSLLDVDELQLSSDFLDADSFLVTSGLVPP
ncbi:hypothetical protein GUITHDRAFT_161916 [Guillardia theta CCMP2712]|uniref:Uncharacterized protein n=1 Tax=Guillardia theta (strain CCMP2712) TaxID=905079 RepID=L1JNY9_GUITC|nr:hypothetical protein GUITHDRAFT_161916 [Guillardia theta CCMP2712]EKX50281.1 hypothetical protein GUITHDRAFT_161916 [Guillardia theta CCMP2712]|eukprot:XP_005837261.1 hypothetical protein GUITHDRAFT_161916 [Guillardia theta CCMP2712]